MDSDSVAFWGVTVKSGEPLKLELKQGESLNVTMASLGPKLADPKGRSVVMVDTVEQEMKFACCVLRANNTECTTLDLHFEGEENVTFSLVGKNEVHLTGNFAFEEDDEEDDDDDGEDLMEALGGRSLMDLDGKDDDEDDEDEEEGDTVLNQPPVIKELKGEDEDDDDDDEDEDDDEDDVEMPSAGANDGEKDDDEDEEEEEEEEEEKPKTTQKKSVANGAKKSGKGIKFEKKFEKKKAAEKKKQEKVETKTEAEEPKEEKKPKAASNKRKSVDAKVATPAKKAKSDVNGDAEVKTPETKTAPSDDSQMSRSQRKRYRKRKSKAGNTPAAK